MDTLVNTPREMLRTLPGDDVRQILWRFADRYDLQMLVQSARAVARGPVARLVAEGARNTHEWTPEKNRLLKAFDEAGITAVFMDPEQGGFIEGPKNLALALVAFELAWVDAGAATGSLAGNLALAPIHERGTPEQTRLLHEPGAPRAARRGPQALARRLRPHRAASPTSASRPACSAARCASPSGRRARSRSSRWTSAAASSPTWASPTSSPPPWIPTTRASRAAAWSSWRRPTPASSTAARPPASWSTSSPPPAIPVFSLRVPASRIIGGYTVKDGVIVPNYSHGEIIEAVFRRTRVTVGAHDLGQAALGRRAGDPLPARPLPRRRRRRPGLAALRPRPAAEGGRRCTAWSTSGPPARPAPRSASPPRASSTNSTRSRRRRTRSSPSRASTAAAAHFKALRPVAEGRARVPRPSVKPERRATDAPSSRPTRWCSSSLLDSLANVLCPAMQALEHRPRRQHDARGRQPDGRLRHHRGLPRLPRPQVDGRAARGHLRRPRGRAAPPAHASP